MLGASFQKHLGVGAIIMGWGISELAIMIHTVAVYAYLNDCFPKHQVCAFLWERTRPLHVIFLRVKSVLLSIWPVFLVV